MRNLTKEFNSVGERDAFPRINYAAAPKRFFGSEWLRAEYDQSMRHSGSILESEWRHARQDLDSLKSSRGNADTNITKATQTVVTLQGEQKRGWQHLLNTSMLTVPAALAGAAAGAVYGGVKGIFDGAKAVIPESPEAGAVFTIAFLPFGAALMAAGAACGAVGGVITGACEGAKTAGLKVLGAVTPEGQKTYFEASAALNSARERYTRVAANHGAVYRNLRENLQDTCNMEADMRSAAAKFNSVDDIKGLLTSRDRAPLVMEKYAKIEGEMLKVLPPVYPNMWPSPKM